MTEVPHPSSRGRSRRQRAGTPGREFVQGIDRGFAVIRAFGSDRTPLTISQVAELTGLTRAVSRRYLFTLLKLGYVTQDQSEFSLAPRLLELGFSYLSTTRIPQVAPPVMERLVSRLHESCSVAVLDGPEIVYIARVSADRLMSINLVVGSRLPAHATSMGKVLLAHLTRAELNAYLSRHPLRAVTAKTVTDGAGFRALMATVRQQGWAVTDGHLEEGVRSAAAPIFDSNRRVVAAINVSAHAARVSAQELKRTYLPILLETAAEISKML